MPEIDIVEVVAKELFNITFEVTQGEGFKVSEYSELEEVYKVAWRKSARSLLLKLQDEYGVVRKVGEIQQLERNAADNEAFVAPGVGWSWERDSSVFKMFKQAGYVRVEPLIKEK
jgi:hypothetical protein